MAAFTLTHSGCSANPTEQGWIGTAGVTKGVPFGVAAEAVRNGKNR
jgi:hypothetical protein